MAVSTHSQGNLVNRHQKFISQEINKKKKINTHSTRVLSASLSVRLWVWGHFGKTVPFGGKYVVVSHEQAALLYARLLGYRASRGGPGAGAAGAVPQAKVAVGGEE